MQDSIPSHIIGATAGSASRLAGNEASDTASKALAISGAVASVAEIVTPAPSASGAAIRGPLAAGLAEQEVAEARGPEQDPDHRGEAELPADVAARSRVEREGEEAGEQDRVPARARPPGQRRHHPGRAHDAGALDRGPGAGQRHVEGDQRQDADQPGPKRHSDAAPGGRPPSRASSITVSPETASRWARPERLKSSTVAGAIRSSSPSRNPRRSAASGSGVPAPERALGALADAVRRAPPGRRVRVPSAAGGRPPGPRGSRTRSRYAASQGSGSRDRARRRRSGGRSGRSGTGSEASTASRPSAVWIANGHLGRRSDAGPRSRSPRAVAGLPIGPSKAPAVDRREAQRAERDAAQRGGDERRERHPDRPGRVAARGGRAATRLASAAADAPQQRREPGRAPRRRRAARAPAPPWRRRGSRSAGTVAARRAQGWSRARKASMVAGPIPSISSSWSIEETPPCWSR